VSNGILSYFTDTSLSALVPRLKEQQVQVIIDRLTAFADASQPNAELRDISSTGMSLKLVNDSIAFCHH
jgi:hypothetical protein